ncbi:MAG: hypothetical protein OEU95_00030 [Nitrospirota bacterium]|nr:hypothetical protein [Nitrospirota bacterium]
MKPFIDFIRFLIISPEFLILLVAFVLYEFFSDYLVIITLLISKKTEMIKHFALVPSFIMIAIFKMAKSLLFPEKDKKEILQSWPDYYKLKLGFEVAILYSILFAIIGILGWALDWNETSPLPALGLLTALFGSSTVFITTYKAEITINETFARENDR